MSSSASSFEAAYNKVIEDHKKQKDRLNQYVKKHEQALERVWSLQMKCFYNGNKECIQNHDEIFLEHHRFTREKIFSGRKCVNECMKISEGFNFDAKPNSWEDFDKTKKYYGCITPCIEKIIMQTNAQISIVDKNIQVVSGFLDKA
jgi:hypothetical protein